MSIWKRLSKPRLPREWIQAGNDNVGRAHDQIWGILSDRELDFLQAKWSQPDIPSLLATVKPPRPRSVPELAELLGVNPLDVIRFDMDIIGRLIHAPGLDGTLAKVLLVTSMEWLLQYAEDAPAWWDSEIEPSTFPNGDAKVKCSTCDALNSIPWEAAFGPGAPRKLPCETCGADVRKQWED